MSDMCTTCGLPDELCVCEDVEKGSMDVTVYSEERKYNDVTLVDGIDDEDIRDDLSSDLKSAMACGGTVKNGKIELQGDHVDSVVSELDERGYEVTKE